MKKKKKVNPHKQPVQNADRNAILEDVTSRITERCWAAFLGSIIDFSDTTQESIIQIWLDANAESLAVAKTADTTEDALKIVDDILGMTMPYPDMGPINLTTQGGINNFVHKAEQKCSYAAFALMAKPMILSGKYSTEFLTHLFTKAQALAKDLEMGKEVSLQDIYEVLDDEFGLRVEKSGTGLHLLQKENSEDHFFEY